jgi:glycosyltransferase involved in cell wall biosynthesis
MSAALSVALCTYNGEGFVREQLESILSQRPAVAELIVCDDGSSDRTLSIVRKAISDSTVDGLVERNEAPLGVTKNFEKAIGRTTQPLIALSDQDDVWHAGRVEAVTNAFAREPGLTLLHSDARLVDSVGNDLGRTLFSSLEVTNDELAEEQAGRAFETFLRRNLATGATMIFRRELFELASPFPVEWVHDEWLAIIAAATGNVQVWRQPTIDYRQHTGNQIGVAAPTLRRKIRRVLTERADRNELLAKRFRILANRLATLGVPSETLQAARDKADFEERRAMLPANRLKRLPKVVRLATLGDYRRFASRRNADIVRDILQPAGNPGTGAAL